MHLDRLRVILRDTLSLGERAQLLNESSPLLGAVPEFDSMAVIAVVTALEDEFGITVHDEELSGELFATVGSLLEFVHSKIT